MTCCFIQLQDTNVPHVVEKIFFSLDYEANVARLLLDAGAEVDKTDKLGETALHHAAHFGQMDVLQLLVMSGADRRKTNQKGESPIAIALMKNYYLPPSIYQKL